MTSPRLGTGAELAGVAGTERHSSGTPRGSDTVLRAIEIFVVLQLLIPSRLVISPLGQIGSPATLWGLLCMLWYGLSLLWSGSGLQRGRQPFRWVVLVILGAWMISWIAMIARIAPLDEQTQADARLIHLLAWVGIALLAADGLASSDQILRLCRFLSVIAAIVAAIAMLQFLGFDPVEWMNHLPGLKEAGLVNGEDLRGSFTRARGTTAHPIELAAVLTMFLPLSVQLAWWSPSRWRWLCPLLIAVAIPLTISRTGFLGVVVGMLVVGKAWDKRRRLRVTGAVLVIAGGLFLTVPGFLGTTAQYLGLKSGGDTSLETRTNDYEAVSPYVDDAPVLGRGSGTFTPPRYRVLDNQYLLALVETGIIGLVALVLLFVIPALLARDAWCRAHDPRFADIAHGLFAGAVVAAVAPFAFDAFSFLAFSAMAFLVLGTCAAAWRVERRGC